MRLPNAEQAVVEERKITEYLLNEMHPDGASKARFGRSFGFSTARWRDLAEPLLELARRSEVLEAAETSRGWRDVVRCQIRTPVGRRPTMRTVWDLERGSSAPRLIAAFPD